MKGHLYLRQEDSKGDIQHSILQNFILFSVYVDGQKHLFWQFVLWLRPHTSADINIRDALLARLNEVHGELLYYPPRQC